MEVDIESSWKQILQEEFDKEYFASIVSKIKEERKMEVKIYPPGNLIFNAFNITPYNSVKVVILGQDPYHGANQAHGLSFSVPDGVSPPPSLQNIFKEIESDTGTPPPKTGNLERWAKQGVFLLNSILTVRAGQAASHSQIGWAEFTDAVIKKLSLHNDGLIFLLWGKFAQSKRELIDSGKHTILVAAHPSPLARGAFFGCRHFSQVNKILTDRGDKPIIW